MRVKESLPGAEEAVALVCWLRWRCCGGGRWRCQAALWFQRQLQAVLLSPTVQRRSSRFLAVLSFSHVPSRFLAFLPLSVGFSVSLSYVSVDFLSYSLSSVFFFLRVLSLFFSLFFFVFSSLSFPPPSPRCLSQRSWVLFIEPRAWLFTVVMGSSRLVGHWARLPRFGSHRFSGRCVVGGRPVCLVGGLQAREGPAKFKQKPLFSFFPAAMFGGEEERGTVSFKTTPFCSFFFDKMHETTSFWRKRAVSFKCGARTRQFSNQPSIIFCSFQLHPCQN